jgi:hypothetical protein
MILLYEQDLLTAFIFPEFLNASQACHQPATGENLSGPRKTELTAGKKDLFLRFFVALP